MAKMTGTLIALVAVFVTVDASNQAQNALNLFKTPSQGKGSYYGPGLAEHGTCRLIDPKPAYTSFAAIKMDVAMNKEQFFGSLACGMCLKVNHDVEGEFYAYVQDLCMGCGEGGLDLGVMGHGKPKQSIQAIQCPVGNTKMQYKIEGNPWNWKVQVRNARVPISEFSVKQKDGTYRALVLQTYGAFTGSVRLNEGIHDVEVKMKSVNGFDIIDVIPKVDYSKSTPFTGSAQVPLDSSLLKMIGDDSKGGRIGPGGGSVTDGNGTGGKGTGGTGTGTGGKGTGGTGTGTGGKGTGGTGTGNGGKGGKTGGGGTVKPSGPFSCTNRPNGTYGDPGDCKAFVQCADGRLFRFFCPTNMKFDVSIMNCNHANAAKCAK